MKPGSQLVYVMASRYMLVEGIPLIPRLHRGASVATFGTLNVVTGWLSYSSAFLQIIPIPSLIPLRSMLKHLLCPPLSHFQALLACSRHLTEHRVRRFSFEATSINAAARSVCWELLSRRQKSGADLATLWMERVFSDSLRRRWVKQIGDLPCVFFLITRG